MGCSKCGRPGVIYQEYSGMDLCRQHFREDLLHKAKKTVRQNRWLVPGRRYAIALSGEPVSCALLDFMQTLVGERKDISLIAVTIKNKDLDAVENAERIAGSTGIPWYTVPEDSTVVKMQQGNRSGTKNQSPFPDHAAIECQVMRIAEQLKVDAIVMGYTLEDHAEWVLLNAISGKNVQKPVHVSEGRRQVRIIRPFMHIPESELKLYTRLFLNECHEVAQVENNSHDDNPVITLLARFYSRHPGVPYALVNIGEQIKKFRDQAS